MKKIIYATICILCVVNTYAQHKSMTDTVFSIKEIEILGGSEKKTQVGKLDVTLQYLPMSVNSVSAKTLEIRGITNIEDAVKFLPGVRMNTSYGAFQTLSVRGMTYTPIMIDGIRDERTLINSYPFPDLTNIESMELLKGPASVLYGHSVLGGVLNVVRKSPVSQNVVNAQMSYGSWNNKQANLDFGGKVAGPVNYRANFNYSDQDGWRDTGNKRFSGYFALGANIDASSKIDVRGGFHRDMYGTEAGLPPVMMTDVYSKDGTLYLKANQELPGLNEKARYNNESDFFKNNGWDVSAKYEKNLNKDLKLTNYLSYRYDDINYFSTEELSYLYSMSPIYDHYMQMGKTKMYINLDSVQLTSPLRFSHIAKMLNNQLELSGNFYTGNIKHNFMGGYSFSQMFRDSYTGYNNAPTDDRLNPKYDVYGPGLYSVVAVNNPHCMGYMSSKFSKAIVTKDYSHGIYFQDLIELNDKFKVLLAGRYDFYKYMRANSIDDQGKEINTLPTYNGKREYHRGDQIGYSTVTNASFTYRAGIVYLPIPNLSIYASAASYYRPDRTFASANNVYLNKKGKEIDINNIKNLFDPENGYQFEVGTRYSHKDIFQASASIFYIRKNDVVRNFGKLNVGTDSEPVSKNVIGQISGEEAKGFDIELTLTPTSYSSINFGYSYTDTKTKEIEPNPFIKVDTQNITLVPHNTFYAYGSIFVPKGIFQGLAYNLSVSFMDKVYTNYAKTMSYSSYCLTDMGVSYPFRNGVRLSLNVNNIFDKKYSNQAIYGTQRVPGMPRNYMVSLSYSLK